MLNNFNKHKQHYQSNNENEGDNITGYYRNNRNLSFATITKSFNETEKLKLYENIPHREEQQHVQDKLTSNVLNNEEKNPLNKYSIGSINEQYECKNIPSITTIRDNIFIIEMLDLQNGIKDPINTIKSIESDVRLNDKTKIAIKGKSRSLCNYLKCGSQCSSKIAPIIEETETDTEIGNKTFNTNKGNATTTSGNTLRCCLNMKSCWPSNNVSDIEVYNTRTIIKRTRIKKMPQISQIAMNSQEVQTVANNPLECSQHDNIHLKQYGLIRHCDNNHYYNNDNVYKINSSHDRSVPRMKEPRALHNFYWLLRPFRGKYRKPKRSSKIHAVVYKTYFMKWMKPPDCLVNGYGIKRYSTASIESFPKVIRRCRSANF